MTIYKTIADLTPATAVGAADELEILQGGTSRSITVGQLSTTGVLSGLSFGMSPLSSDNAAAFSNAYSAAKAAAKALYIPAGSYAFATQVDLDTTTSAQTAIPIIGDGKHITTLDFGSVASPQFRMSATNGSSGMFYGGVKGISFKGNVDGVTAQFGRSDLSDFFNSVDLDITASNGSTGASAVALQINNHYDCSVRYVANCGGTSAGIALDLNQVQFSRFTGSAGNALKLYNLRAFSFANVFSGCDAEVGGTAYTFNSSGCTDNVIIAGTVANVAYAFDGIAGARNRIINQARGTITTAPFNGIVGLVDDRASGVTGASSSNLVYSNAPTLASPTLTTPTLTSATLTTPNIGVATGTSLALTGSVTVASGAFFQAAASANFYLRAQTAGFGGLIAGDSVTIYLQDGSTQIGQFTTLGLQLLRPLRRGAPVTKTADFSVALTENWLTNNKAGSACSVTLPAVATHVGREIMITNYQAQTVISASANVVPLGGGAAGTAILSANIGRWCTLVSDATNWIIVAGVV